MTEVIRDFKQLKVWQRSIELVEKIYQIVNYFPHNENFGLSSQLKRAAVSIPSNIAEGFNRTHKDYIRFLTIALGSLAELETQLIISYRVKLSKKEKVEFILNDLNQITKMISALISKLKG